MKVSFIVPIYNVEPYIQDCIESILKQKGCSFEIVLINDGSTDRSEKICKKYAEKYSNIKFVNQRNQGVSVARNEGLKYSCGEWVFFVDADDTISPKLISSCVEFLNEENDVCFVKHKEVLNEKLMSDDGILKQKFDTKSINKEDFEEFILATFNRDYQGKFDYHEVKMATPCKFYRKKIIDCYRISFPVGIKTGEDALFNLQFYKYANRGIYINSELYFHRVWKNSVSQRYNPEVQNEFEKLHNKLREYIANSEQPTVYTTAFFERCIWSFGFCCILNYCNRDNPKTYRERKADFQRDRKKYYFQIKNVKLKNFRIQKKIFFFCIKMNCFRVIDLLCKINSSV